MTLTRTIIRARIPSIPGGRFGRHINHDSKSRGYELDTTDVELVNTRHPRYEDIFDQGNLGSCVPNAGVGCLATGRYYDTVNGSHITEWDESFVLDNYRKVTRADPYEGAWEPDDTGSDGLSMAKVFLADGLISGYQWTFSANDAFKALTLSPFITGTYWYNGMFYPDADGRVRLTGSLAGGHEYVADELDVDRERIWFTNSWGVSWGINGRFYMTFEDYATLLGRDGDVTIFTPLTEPAPAPVIDPDEEFAKALRPWCDQPHYFFGNDKASAAAREWLTATGR